MEHELTGSKVTQTAGVCPGPVCSWANGKGENRGLHYETRCENHCGSLPHVPGRAPEGDGSCQHIHTLLWSRMFPHWVTERHKNVLVYQLFLQKICFSKLTNSRKTLASQFHPHKDRPPGMTPSLLPHEKWHSNVFCTEMTDFCRTRYVKDQLTPLVKRQRSVLSRRTKAEHLQL